MKEYKGWKIPALNLLPYILFVVVVVFLIVITPSETDEFPGYNKF